MEFKKYDDIRDFVNENMDLIEKEEWQNNLIIGNCTIGLKNGSDGWLLARVTDNGKTELIMLHRRPWELLLYTPTNNTSDELYKYAAEEVYKIDNNLNGVNARKDIGIKFSELYSKVSGKKMEVDVEMRILLLEKLIKGNLMKNAKMRLARDSERELLKKYAKEFNRDALGKDIEEDLLNENLDRYYENGFYVLEVDGEIVSQAAVGRSMKHGKNISHVHTPRQYRNKGYAYNLVYKISEMFLNEGNDYCVLFTDAGNPISNHVYEKIGYKYMDDFIDMKFE